MNQFSQKHIDILKELINIGVGRGANVLNTMLTAHIVLRVPMVKILTKEDLNDYLNSFGENPMAIINLPFKGDISGSTKLIFPTESAANLVDAFTGEQFGDEEDFDSIRVGTLKEIGNIVINSIMGSLSNMLKTHFQYVVPNFQEGTINDIFISPTTNINQPILLAQAHFSIDKFKVVGNIAIFLEIGAYENLIKALDAFVSN